MRPVKFAFESQTELFGEDICQTIHPVGEVRKHILAVTVGVVDCQRNNSAAFFSRGIEYLRWNLITVDESVVLKVHDPNRRLLNDDSRRKLQNAGINKPN